MEVNGIKMNAIHKTLIPGEDGDIYAYIRGWKKDEIGFSVLDRAVKHLDFSNCGVFWVKQKDFTMLFEVFREN